jgi:Tfp pilus assembly protein PilP
MKKILLLFLFVAAVGCSSSGSAVQNNSPVSQSEANALSTLSNLNGETKSESSSSSSSSVNSFSVNGVSLKAGILKK